MKLFVNSFSNFLNEGMKQHQIHPYIVSNSSESIQLAPEDFNEWFPIEGMGEDEIQVELQELSNRMGVPMKNVYRYGFDMSGDDNTGIIAKVLDEEYEVLEHSTIWKGERQRRLIKVLVDTVIPVWIVMGDIAEDKSEMLDLTYAGFYVALSDEYLTKMNRK